MNKFIVKPNKSVKEIIDSNGWRATEKRVESVEEINLIRKEAERQFILDEFNAFGVYATQRGIPVSDIENQWIKWSEEGVIPSREMMSAWVRGERI